METSKKLQKNNFLPTPEAKNVDGGYHKSHGRKALRLGTFISSPEASLASHSHKQGNDEARKTTAISGRKCSESYSSRIRIGSSLKMCVDSLLGTTEWFSSRCVLTWKAKDTKSSRLLFQLAPQTLRTDERGFGLLPTAQAIDGSGKGRPFRLKKDCNRDPEKPGSWRGGLERPHFYDTDSESAGRRGRDRICALRTDNQKERDQARGKDQGFSWDENWIEVATKLCGMDDGLPAELDGLKLSKARHRVERLKGLGNAIVPQVAIEIMKAIKISI